MRRSEELPFNRADEPDPGTTVVDDAERPLRFPNRSIVSARFAAQQPGNPNAPGTRCRNSLTPIP
jgi:hypothetical protein